MTQYEYDAAGRLIVEREGNGRISQRNTYNARGQLVTHERNGIAYHLRPTDNKRALPAGEPQKDDVTADDHLQLIVDAMANCACNRPLEPQIRAIHDAITLLDKDQRARLQSRVAAQHDIYVDVVDSSDIETLFGDAQQFLPGATSLQPSFYQAGNRWLMLCTKAEDVTLERCAMLDHLLAHSRLQRRASDVVVFSIADAFDVVRILAGELSVEIDRVSLVTRWDRLHRAVRFPPGVQLDTAPDAALAQHNPRRLNQLLIEQGLIPPNRSVLVLDGDLPALYIQRALAHHSVWYTYYLDAEEVASNIDYQRALELVMEDIVLVNGAPGNKDEVAFVGRAGEKSREWYSIRSHWTATAAKCGLSQVPGAAATLLDGLRTKRLVILVLARSDGACLFFPDSSSLNLETLDHGEHTAIKNNGPVVWLVSCKSGSIQDRSRLVKSLLEAGARGVLLPLKEIPARSSTRILTLFTQGIRQKQTFLESLWDATRGSDMVYSIGPAGGGSYARRVPMPPSVHITSPTG